MRETQAGEYNGRIKMTLPQAISVLALLGAITGSWYDTRTQLLLARQEIEQLRASVAVVAAGLLGHERLPGHAGVMERADGLEKRLDRLER